jgi:hypothetical protein
MAEKCHFALPAGLFGIRPGPFPSPTPAHNRMRVNGEPTTRATLRDGDEVAIGELRLTFKDDIR